MIENVIQIMKVNDCQESLMSGIFCLRANIGFLGGFPNQRNIESDRNLLAPARQQREDARNKRDKISEINFEKASVGSSRLCSVISSQGKVQHTIHISTFWGTFPWRWK